MCLLGGIGNINLSLIHQRPPKYYKSFNRAEITQRKLQKYYPKCNVYIEVVENK